MDMRLMLIAALALSGCTLNNATPRQTTTPAPADCGAQALSDLIGEPAHNHDFNALADDVRILPPGSAMTMDHRPKRLNVDVNIDGDIARLWCG